MANKQNDKILLCLTETNKFVISFNSITQLDVLYKTKMFVAPNRTLVFVLMNWR